MGLRNEIMLELLVVAAATAVTTVVLRGPRHRGGASVVALWALLYLLLFDYLTA